MASGVPVIKPAAWLTLQQRPPSGSVAAIGEKPARDFGSETLTQRRLERSTWYNTPRLAYQVNKVVNERV